MSSCIGFSDQKKLSLSRVVCRAIVRLNADGSMATEMDNSFGQFQDIVVIVTDHSRPKGEEHCVYVCVCVCVCVCLWSYF